MFRLMQRAVQLAYSVLFTMSEAYVPLKTTRRLHPLLATKPAWCFDTLTHGVN
jgi:hypothetical protein